MLATTTLRSFGCLGKCNRMETRDFVLGTRVSVEEAAQRTATVASNPQGFALPAHHLVTHGVVLGMTGSGKTGLLMVLVEEALRSKVPTVLIDIKGDLPNLLFLFPELAASSYQPWVDEEAARRSGQTREAMAAQLATQWSAGLASAQLAADDVRALRESVHLRVVTPGASIAEPLNVLSSLSHRSALWGVDDEAAHDELAAGISLVLRLAGFDGEPRGREHVVLSALAVRRIERGEPAPLAVLLSDLLNPPIAQIGAMAFDDFFPPKDRQALAQGLNTLLASPRLASWQKGAPLDVASWLAPRADGKTPAVIVSVAHLEDEERLLVLGLLLDQMLSYVRGLSGSSSLRALLVFDEIFGFLPPHPHNPPTKRPLLALLKQARAFGVGTIVATQNPMDVDYKALSNAGAWIIGRLQTDADRERVVEGLRGADGGLSGLEPGEVENLLRNLPPRTFFVRDVHAKPACGLVRSRCAMSWLRGPVTRRELAAVWKALADRPVEVEVAQAAAPAASLTAPGAPTAQPVSSVVAGNAAVPAAGASTPATSAVATVAPAFAEGWHAFFEADARAQLKPWLFATIVLRVRSAKLGFSSERKATLLAPFDLSGRPELGRAQFTDPARFAPSPGPGASFGELPSLLGTKKGREGIEKSLRDHAVAQGTFDVEVHRELALCRADGESAEAFRERCRQESLRRLGESQRQIQADHAPKIAKLEARYLAAQLAAQNAQASLQAAPSDLGAALVGLALGRQAGARVSRGRDKAAGSMQKAHEAFVKADIELRAAVAERDTELAAATRDVDRVAFQIEAERVLAKKGDAEVLAIGVLWRKAAVE
jgi:hypothetical protein